MKKRLMHNLGLKILSVVLATFIWLIMVNVSNPLMTETQTVAVQVLNADVLEDAGLTYELLGRDTVTVSYKIHVRDQNRVDAEDFTAHVDLAQLYDVTGAVPVQVEIANLSARQFLSGETLTVTPSVIRIQTEPLQTKSFSLEARTDGEVENGYAVGEISMSPSVVYATGAESEIGQISSIGFEVNVEGANADLQGQSEIHFYDANGNELDELENTVSLSVSSVNYNVTILRVKELTLDFQVEGTVASGYRFTGVTCDVQTILVEGLRSSLANLSTLTIPGDVLNVNGAVQDVVTMVDLSDYLPPDIRVVGGGPAQVMVTMMVEPLETRTFTYDVGQIDMLGLSDQYRYAFNEQQIELRIRGLKDDLDRLTPGDIKASMALNGLGSGEHQIELSVVLPEGFDFIGPASVRIKIEQIIEETTALESSQEERTEARE